MAAVAAALTFAFVSPAETAPVRLRAAPDAGDARRSEPLIAVFTGTLLARANLCATRIRAISRLVEAGVGSGLGQRPADFEPEFVHRGLLAHREVFALRLSFGLLGRAGDVDGDLRLDLGMQVNRTGAGRAS